MKLTDIFNEVISFSRSEKRGIIILLVLIVVLVLSKYYMHYNSGKVYSLKIYDQQESSIATENTTNENYKSNSLKNLQNNEKVNLDPNNAVYSELLTAGFSRFAATNILKFRDKGGRFSKPADLFKIYGVDSTEFLKIAPYISIAELQSKKYSPSTYGVVNKGAKITQTIEINSADSLELIRLPGIGPVLSKRILKYRNSLGGFYSKEQLREIYGMSDSTFLKIEGLIITDTSFIRKIQLNTVSLASLKSHPYLNNSQAKAIISYRQMMQGFKDKEDLLENYILTDETYCKIAPYLGLQ